MRKTEVMRIDKELADMGWNTAEQALKELYKIQAVEAKKKGKRKYWALL